MKERGNQMIVLKRKNNCVFSDKKLPTKSEKGEYNYLILIHSDNQKIKLIKIGTTNDIARRMYEHLGYYNKDITILWISPHYSKYTTLRVEDNTKNNLKSSGYKWIRNDRFEVPKELNEIVIKVIKEYHIRI